MEAAGDVVCRSKAGEEPSGFCEGTVCETGNRKRTADESARSRTSSHQEDRR
jgi:hypothetical protein